MLRVLITGITGFIGSHIAENLVNQNFHVIGLKRIESDPWRCLEFSERIDWVALDEGSWQAEIIEKRPDIIIHSAWIGVTADSRDDWSEQGRNIPFLISLLEIGTAVKLKRFIFLGSQAEYGLINGKVSELETTSPISAYGTVKLASLEILKSFASLNEIKWVWLRVFAVFGEKEDSTWLIPSVISKMLSEQQMDLTYGEQKYAYMYVQDLSDVIANIIHKDVESGVYNISSNEVRTLRSLLELIKNEINPSFKLNFGAIPYRKNQSMHVEGSIEKIEKQLGKVKFTDFNEALDRTVQYYIKHKQR
ncbi:NAD(P)-dependent oxidoreductase [Flavihumibacter sp. R14]|nr:NAD(P)-dependent oxidoreductase [Flavihumibacter soli]